MKRTFLKFVALTALTALAAFGAVAGPGIASAEQAGDYRYCSYSYAVGRNECFDSLAAAESWMKAETTPASGRPFLEPRGGVRFNGPLTSPTSMEFDYYVKPRGPNRRLESYLSALSTQPTGVGVKCACPRSGVAQCYSDRMECGSSGFCDECVSADGSDAPVYAAIDYTFGNTTNFCSYSTETASAWPSPPDFVRGLTGMNGSTFPANTGGFDYSNGYAWFNNANPSVPPHQLQPFNKQVILRFRQRLSASVCATQESRFNLGFHRTERFECVVGLHADGAATNTQGGAFPNATRRLIGMDEVCISSAIGTITAYRLPQDACEYGNPCVPATGEKTQTETDFTQGALTLARTYSSSRLAATNSFLGGGWQHGFGEYIAVPTSTTIPARLFHANVRGHFERFDRVGATQQLRSVNRTGSLIIANTDAGGAVTSWTLRSAAGELRQFDQLGRLVSIEQPDDPAAKLSISYSSGQAGTPVGAVQRVTDALGRALIFSYGPANPVATCGSSAAPGCSDVRLTSVLLPDQSSVVYAYDLAGVLVSAGYLDGSSRLYHYNESANICPQSMPNACIGGAVPSGGFPYALTGISEVSPAAKGSTVRRFSTYQYDFHERVISSAWAGGVGTHTLEYPTTSTARLTFPEGKQRSITFSTQSGMFRKDLAWVDLDPLTGTSLSTQQTFDSDGRKATLTDPRQIVQRYEYSANGLHQSALEEASSTNAQRRTEIAWDDAINRITETRVRNELGATVRLTRFTYNARSQLTSHCEVDPSIALAVAYTCGSSRSAPTGVRQSVTNYCEAVDVAAPGSTCPVLGLTKSSDGPRIDIADTTNLSYYAADASACGSAPATCAYRKGDLWKITNALNHVTEYVSYDSAGRATRIKDENGILTDLSYHGRGWLLSRTVRANLSGFPSPADAVTTFTYDSVGMVTRITQADGAFIHYTYDDAHRLTKLADNLGNAISYTLNAAGKRTAENTRDPNNQLTRNMGRVYDNLGRLYKVLNAQNAQTIFTYDASGNVDTVTDALMHATDSEVDPLNRLIQNTDALLHDTQYRYDARDNVVEVTDAKTLSTHYTYDGLGNLKTLESPDSGATNYTYDSAGNLATQIDARLVLSSYSYDALNRLTGISYPTASNNIVYSYDQFPAACPASQQYNVGRLTGFTDSSGSTTFCYDKRGNLKRKVAVVNGVTQSTSWGHNLGDRITQITYPSGAIVIYGRDAIGRVNSVSVTPAGGTPQNLITAVTYYPFGPVSYIAWGNGAATKRTYDQNYWIDSIDSSQNGGLDLDFSLDAIGNITSIATAIDFIGSEIPYNKYAYDPLSHLTSVGFELPNSDALDVNIESYTYDAVGNRLSKTVGDDATENYVYATTSHRLQQVGSATRAYDANGNTTNPYSNLHGGNGFLYDERNRLRELHSGYPGALTHRYTYNARGERVFKYAKLMPQTSRTFGYDEAGHLLTENDKEGAALQEFIWLDDMPVGLLANGILHYVQADHLGTPRKVIVPATNTAIWDWPILGNPFGEAEPNGDPDGNGTALTLNLRFPGQYFDAESRLHYNYFRDYEPGTGRYLESDPIGLGNQSETYPYSESNPISLYDPDGLQVVVPIPRPRPSPYPAPVPLPDNSSSQGRTYGDVGGGDRTSSRDSERDHGRTRGRGRFSCVIRCDGYETGTAGQGKGNSGSGCCPSWIHGSGAGNTANEAWNNAWEQVNFNTPAGCQKRHCRGIAGDCKGRKGSKAK